MRYLTHRWFWTALDWLIPPQCAGCEVPGSRWCPECQAKVKLIEPPYCDVCGRKTLKAGICYRCSTFFPQITAVRSWAIFDGPVRNAVHSLKYKRNLALGDTFSNNLLDVLKKTKWEIDLVTPVPLGIARHRERGYNQASLLAKPIALKLGYHYHPKALARMRETRSQVELTLEERILNVAGAFQAQKQIVTGKKVLVVDDVTTSGSTLDSCADALFQAGAVCVYGLTLACVA